MPEIWPGIVRPCSFWICRIKYSGSPSQISGNNGNMPAELTTAKPTVKVDQPGASAVVGIIPVLQWEQSVGHFWHYCRCWLSLFAQADKKGSDISALHYDQFLQYWPWPGQAPSSEHHFCWTNRQIPTLWLQGYWMTQNNGSCLQEWH